MSFSWATFMVKYSHINSLSFLCVVYLFLLLVLHQHSRNAFLVIVKLKFISDVRKRLFWIISNFPSMLNSTGFNSRLSFSNYVIWWPKYHYYSLTPVEVVSPLLKVGYLVIRSQPLSSKGVTRNWEMRTFNLQKLLCAFIGNCWCHVRSKCKFSLLFVLYAFRFML